MADGGRPSHARMITYFVAFVLSLVVGTAATLVVRTAPAWNR